MEPVKGGDAEMENRFVIVTGMSGAGKTTTLKVLEDLGFMAIDGMPHELLPQLFRLLTNKTRRGAAVTIDVRNVDGNAASAGAQDFMRAIDSVKSENPEARVVFLTASDEELLRRYERTRRVHPLSGSLSYPLSDGILRERELLAPVLERADVVIDTSMMDLRQHRESLMKEFFGDGAAGGISLLISSFGFKFGVPQDSSFVIDVRCLPNPFYVPELRELTGMDAAVRDYLMSFPETKEFMSRCRNFLDFAIPQFFKTVRGQLHIAVGCTGGRHRSVAAAEWLYEAYAGQYPNGVCVLHRDKP